MSVDSLFAPFSVKSLALKNRVVMAPMTRAKSPGQIPGPNVAAYYARRAEGGVGLIITEGTVIDRPGASGDANIPDFHSPAALAGWKRVVEAVHAAGAKIAPQIWHQGMVRAPGTGPHPDANSDGPSGLDAAGEKIVEPMSEQDIAATIDAFAKAAAAAKNLGFDAVEFHGAHGYLIDQFFWEKSNQRTDKWGGPSAAARTAFAAALIKESRARVGPDFPLIMRFSQWKRQDYAAKLAQTPQELEAFLAPMVDAGIDMFHCSQRRFWDAEFESSPLNLAGWTKKLTGKPTITVGSVGLAGADFIATNREGKGAEIADINILAERLAAGEFDLAAIGRALISNPDWANQVRAGHMDRLKAFQAADLGVYP